MISISMNLKEQLLTQGYCILDGSDLIELLDTDPVQFTIRIDDNEPDPQQLPICDNETIDQKLKIIQQELAVKFLDDLGTYTFLHNTIWEGTTSEADKWHSDSNERPDLFFLLYFSNLKQYDEGAFVIKNFETDEEETRIVPNKGTIIVVENNNAKWNHKAEVTEHRRVAACFRFKIEWNDD